MFARDFSKRVGGLLPALQFDKSETKILPGAVEGGIKPQSFTKSANGRIQIAAIRRQQRLGISNPGIGRPRILQEIKLRDRVGLVAERTVHRQQVKSNFRAPRIDFQRPPQMAGSFRQLFLISTQQQEPPKLVLCRKIFFIDLERCSFRFNRLDSPTHLPKCVSEVRLIVGLMRIESHRTIQIFDGLRVMPESHPCISTGVQSFSIVWLGLEFLGRFVFGSFGSRL